MAEKRRAKKGTPKAAPKAAKSSTANRKASTGFTDEERAAMRERVRELKRPAKGDEEGEVLAKIAGMQGSDRTMGERIHGIVTAAAPGLSPKLWYGMPAYAKDGQVVCFFQDARKFKSRYAMLGFSDKAKLDDGQMWPTYFALKDLTAADEARITALVKKAVS
jgi:uncharacterized protein YdhG (YjbR/CyaY superfamily)